MSPPAIACIGGAHIDRRGILRAPLVLGTSNPGAVFMDLGGVARNVAQNLARLGSHALLCSRVGSDEAGRYVLAQPIDNSLITVSNTRPTASYTAVLEPTGELVVGLADMNVYDEITVDFMVKDSQRFADSGGWGYAVFDYDGASAKFTPGTMAGKPPQGNDAKCGFTCHTAAKARDYVFTEYGAR